MAATRPDARRLSSPDLKLMAGVLQWPLAAGSVCPSDCPVTRTPWSPKIEDRSWQAPLASSPPTAHNSPPRALDASPAVEVEFELGQSPPHPLGLGSAGGSLGASPLIRADGEQVTS